MGFNRKAAVAAMMTLGFAGSAVAGPMTEIVEATHEHGAGCIHAGLSANAGTRLPTKNFNDISNTVANGSGTSLAALAANPNGSAGQTVFLDFSGPSTFRVALQRLGQTAPTPGVFYTGPNGRTVFDTFVFSQADKDFIQARMEADYAKFNVKFTQTAPATGDYAIVNLNNPVIQGRPNITAVEIDTDGDGVPNGVGFSILFGQAQAIDFGNRNKNDYTGLDGNYWNFRLQAGLSITAQSGGLPNTPEGVRTAVLSQASNTGAHELGHNLGLRHHDAFGPIGQGISGLGGAGTPGNFFPTYPGPAGLGPNAAFESANHIIASGASVGQTLAQGLANKYFGVREATKLAFNEQGDFTNETGLAIAAPGFITTSLPELAGPRGDNIGVVSDIRQLVMQDLNVPITAQGGRFENGGFDVRAASVQGRIDPATIVNGVRVHDVDMFAIEGRAGEIMSIEVMSQVFGFADFVLGQVAVFDDQFALIDYFGTPASNILEGEANDPLIWDLKLGYTGRYYIGFWSPVGILTALGANTPVFFSGDYNMFVTLTRVPEPAAIALLGMGVLGIAAARRRRRAA